MNIMTTEEILAYGKREKRKDFEQSEWFRFKEPFYLITEKGVAKVTPFVSADYIQGRFTNSVKFKMGEKEFRSLSGLASHFNLKQQ